MAPSHNAKCDRRTGGTDMRTLCGRVPCFFTQQNSPGGGATSVLPMTALPFLNFSRTMHHTCYYLLISPVIAYYYVILLLKTFGSHLTIHTCWNVKLKISQITGNVPVHCYDVHMIRFCKVAVLHWRVLLTLRYRSRTGIWMGLLKHKQEVVLW